MNDLEVSLIRAVQNYKGRYQLPNWKLIRSGEFMQELSLPKTFPVFICIFCNYSGRENF